MEDRQFFANLDTSFVRLDELVNYLVRRNFVGSIFVSHRGYSGEIGFSTDRRLKVTETNERSGEITFGANAFASILSRSKQPGGKISVLKSLGVVPEPTADGQLGRAVIELDSQLKRVTEPSKIVQHVRIEPEMPNGLTSTGCGLLSTLSDFPFDLTNFSEREPETEPNKELELLMDVTSDLLSTIDLALGRAKLDLSSALRKACLDVSERFPCLNPENGEFSYDRGVVQIEPEADLSELAAGLGEALARIFRRLDAAPKLGKVARFTHQKVRQLIQARREDFEQAHFLVEVERAIGIRETVPDR